MELLAIEEQYFAGLVSFDDVLDAYEAAELAREADFDFWLARARFFAVGCLREFAAGEVSPESQHVVIEQYVAWMDAAIARYAGNVTPLRMEKEQTIGDINNAFEGPRLHEQPTPEEKYDVIQSVSDEELEEEAERAATAMGVAHKKRLMIIIGGIVGLVVLLSIILFSCSNRGGADDYDATYYEEFLHLSHLVTLIEDETTRNQVRDFNLNFVNPDERDLPLRVTAPASAELAGMNFYFDEDDVLVRISVRNANYFNDIAADEGLSENILAGYNVDILIDEDGLLSFEINDLAVVITYRNSRFSIDISTSEAEVAGMPEDQQAIWDAIEDRLAAGYTSWAQLIEWAIANNINFDAVENGRRPIDAIRVLIDRYGLVGDYLGAEPGFGTIDDPDAVLLLLNFENLSYNNAIAELSGLNRTSERALETWLDTGGLESLERHFNDVLIHDMDYETNERITTMPDEDYYEIEFVGWDLVRFDQFTPDGEGEVLIERVYRLTEIEVEDEEDDEDDEDDEPETLTSLAPGSWIVGQDIPQGRFVFHATSAGHFRIWQGNTPVVNEILGGPTGVGSVTTYLSNGDEIDLGGHVSFTEVTNRTPSTILGAGNWVVGQDIPAGSFIVTVPLGTGDISIFTSGPGTVHETVGANGLNSIHVDLVNGNMIVISGTDRVVFE